MTFTFGIDPSSRKIAVVLITPKDTIVTSTFHSGSSSDKFKRYASLYNRMLTDTDLGHAAMTGKATIYLEAPILTKMGGPKSLIPQAQASGVVYGVAAHHDIPVVEVDQAHWKKVVIGRGNANKQDISDWLRANHEDWWNDCHGDQDLMDATCIAIYGTIIEKLHTRITHSGGTSVRIRRRKS
jgi:Holliday junction resolvasome RuvABC endonuclease subunit